MDIKEVKTTYSELLKKYLLEGNEEEALYGAYKLGKSCFEAKIGIEEIMGVHSRCLEEIIKTTPQSKVSNLVLKSSNLLIELSIRFGLVCQNYAEMLQKTDERIINAFYKSGEALTTGLDVQKMSSVILDLVINLTDAAGCSIILYEGNKTIVKVSKGMEMEEDSFKCEIFDDVIKEGVTKYVYDLRHEKLPIILKDGREIRSVLALPLIFKGKTRGVLGICMTHPHKYEEKEIALLKSFANHAASAIDNAFLFDELTRHDRMMQALYDIDRVVSQSDNIDEMLKGALDTVMEIMKADGGGIYLMGDDRENMELKVHKGLSEKFVLAVKTLKVGVGVSGIAIDSKKTAAIKMSEYPTSELVPILIEEGASSIASTPFIYREKSLGTINLLYRKEHNFSSEEFDILSSIGKELGVAIENSRLFNELETHHKMLNTIYAIESVVSRSLNIEEVFKEALLKAIEVTDTEVGTLYSYDGNILQLRAFEGFSSDFRNKILIRDIGEGIPGIAAKLKKAITMDISEFPSIFLLPHVKKEGLVSFIGTPLMSKEKVVGALALATRKKRTFSQDDLEILFSIGNVIGIAMENARLYAESYENLEKLKKAYEELQILDKMKEEFISNVSHELKTPLISIRGYSELIYDEKLGNITPEQKKSLEAIIRNSDRLTRLINSILFLSKLQSGKLEINFEPLDLDEIVKSCGSDLKGMMDKKQISFEKDISSTSKVCGEKDKFIEVISNLLDNSIKFTDIGGKILIKTFDEGNNVHIVVSDNGIGIPPDMIPKLFTRFYQVDAKASRKYGGTGLGLYITKNIIDAFKGKIWIESEVGKGTSVHILLPVLKEMKCP